MAIFLTKDSKVIVQGITGGEATAHAARMLKAGTQIVGGVNARKAGTTVSHVDKDGNEVDLPVFGTVAEAIEKTGADVSIIFVPPKFAKDAIIEAIDAQIPLLVVITEGIPVQDTAYAWAYNVDKGTERSGRSPGSAPLTRIIGPNCPGIISPGQSLVGITPANITGPGPIGLVSKSGTLTYQMMYELRDFGFSTAIGIGGDPVIGTTHIDAIEAFEKDPDTKVIVMIGEIGGDAEERAADYIKANVSKPVVGYVAGFTAPEGKTMGHAGAIVSGSSGTAAAKKEALEAAGVKVGKTPSETAALARKILQNPVTGGLEGVVAFTSDIAEPDKDGGALRYRGVDIEDLVGRHVTFGDVWALLVDGRFGPGLPPAEPFPLPVHTGDVRVDVQAGLAMLAPIWGYRPLLDIDDDTAREQLARASVMALSYVAQSARGIYQPAVPQKRIDKAATVTERFMVRWKGEPDPAHVEAIDAYWVSAAEHGMNASTFTARVIASTGADVAASLSGAIGAMSGPLHGGAPARVLPMIEDTEKGDDARAVVKGILDRKEKLMGFGHRVYRAEDPRARVLRATAKRLGAPHYEAAAALEQAALAELRERRPDRAIETNVEFWAAVILDFAEVPTLMMPAMFTCGRTAGWCAHILEQKRLGKLVRPAAIYTGPAPRSPESVEGWDQIAHTH